MKAFTLRSLSLSPTVSSSPLTYLLEGEELEQKNRSSSSRERVRNNELNSKACIDIPSCDHAKVTGREANSEEQLDFPATSEGLRGLSPPKPF